MDTLDRTSLAVLGREWLLHGHLQDRVAMALVMERATREEMQQVAIEEWMAASPIYSRRMQRALNFVGAGVDTIMKNLQLDIGAPHEFMDFRYRLTDRDHGEFWLAHCGALMDVEPMGADFVHGMCHTIEDPTFDATAGATNPRAQVRPIHRPPRAPADRMPHCHWRIDVVSDADPVAPHPNQAIVEKSLLGQLPISTTSRIAAVDGLEDYSGEFDPDFHLEVLSSGALDVALQEFALQSHLLLRALLVSVTQRFGPDFAREILPRLVGGWGGLTAQRIRDGFGLTPDPAGLATMLRLHPMLHPRSYISVEVTVTDGEVVRIGFKDCPAAREADHLTWFSGLGGRIDDGLAAVVRAYDPKAVLTPVATRGDELHSYQAEFDPQATGTGESPELEIAKVSTGARFGFVRPQGRVLPVITGPV